MHHSRAELVPCCKEALRLDPKVQDTLPYHLMQLEQVRARADELDVLHFHTDLLHFPLFRDLPTRTVTTLHGRLDLPDLLPLYSAFPDMPLVSISKAQRWPMPDVNWVGNVSARAAAESPPVAAGAARRLSRVSRPDLAGEGPDWAIEIATRARMPLKIAAKIDEADRDYWTTYRAADRGNPLVEFVGEIGEHRKADFLGDALALLFPIDWPEPFGLVMIEAMACGTPVIAFRRGSVPEVIEAGVSGFIVESVDEAVAAVQEVSSLNRLLVRRAFERRFTVEAMARAYLDIYRALPGQRLRPLSNWKPVAAPPLTLPPVRVSISAGRDPG